MKDSPKEDKNDDEKNKTPQPEVANELSKLVATNKKVIATVISVVISVSFGVYRYLSAQNNFEESKKDTTVQTEQFAKKDLDIEIPSIPKLQDMPKIESISQPLALPPKPVEVPLPVVDTPKPEVDPNKATPPQLPNLSQVLISEKDKSEIETRTRTEEEKTKKEAKIKSSIVQFSGGVPPKKEEGDEIASVKVLLKKKGNLEYVLNKGKIINATLETSINTDFGGEVRAIVSQDVYSEGGKNVLIPKGSRIFGTYGTGYKEPYGRVNINWNRIDLPNGYILEFSSKAIDNLGREGIQGRVDMKYKEKMSNSVLTTAFNIVSGNVIDKMVKPSASKEKEAKMAEANGIKTSMLSTYGGTLPDDQKINQICSQSKSYVTDKTSGAYIGIDKDCNQAAISIASGTADKKQVLTSLVTAINSHADQIFLAANATQTKGQKAAEEGFNQIKETVKGIINKDKLEPTVTIDQGKNIQIYINEDYILPHEAIKNIRILR